LCGLAVFKAKLMSRFPASLGVAALLLVGTAPLTAAPAAPQAAQTNLTQSLESGIKDARAKREARDFNGAIHVLSQLMLVAPDDVNVVGEYGKVLVQQGRAREALDFLNRALQLKGNDWTVYSALGVAYDQTGDYNNARLAYERALALKPGENAVLNNFAMSRMLAGDLPEAKRLIAQASAGASDDRIARNQKLIAGLTPQAVTAVHTPVAAPAAAPVKAGSSLPPAQKPPRQLTQPAATKLAGGTIMMQAVPHDPKAGPAGKAKTRKLASNTPAPKPVSDGIPALRLANDRP
jgi:Flp pilus assembly protein TadD